MVCNVLALHVSSVVATSDRVQGSFAARWSIAPVFMIVGGTVYELRVLWRYWRIAALVGPTAREGYLQRYDKEHAALPLHLDYFIHRSDAPCALRRAPCPFRGHGRERCCRGCTEWRQRSPPTV